MEQKNFKLFMSIAFIITIFGFLLAFIMIKDRSFSDLENRELQQFPTLSIDAIKNGDFTSNFQSYISDQFVLRDRFVKLKGTVDGLFGRDKEEDVYFGKDGYLIQDFTKPQAVDIKTRLDSINEFFSKLTAKKYVLIAPTSIDILKDKLPKDAPAVSEDHYIDSIRKGLSKGTSFIDVRNILSLNKNKYIYYRTDHHWTTLGAYYAYKEACKALNINALALSDYKKVPVTKSFYGSLYARSAFKTVTPDTIEVYQQKSKLPTRAVVDFVDEKKKAPSVYDASWLKQKDKYQIFLGGNHPEIDISTTAKSKRTLLIIKDSYANSFIPFLLPYFKQIKVVDMRYFKGDINNLAQGDITDVMVLYNIKTFFDDTSLTDLE